MLWFDYIIISTLGTLVSKQLLSFSHSIIRLWTWMPRRHTDITLFTNLLSVNIVYVCSFVCWNSWSDKPLLSRLLCYQWTHLIIIVTLCKHIFAQYWVKACVPHFNPNNPLALISWWQSSGSLMWSCDLEQSCNIISHQERFTPYQPCSSIGVMTTMKNLNIYLNIMNISHQVSLVSLTPRYIPYK